MAERKYDYAFLVNTFIIIVAATVPAICWGIYLELKETNRTQATHAALLVENTEAHKTLTSSVGELRSEDKDIKKRLTRVEAKVGIRIPDDYE